MANVQILEKPLALKPGTICWLKKGLSRLVIQIFSDLNGVIVYTYPLKPYDQMQHQAAKADVYLKLSDCENHADLTLNKTPYVPLDRYSKQNPENRRI